jgi:hypothetical protein
MKGYVSVNYYPQPIIKISKKITKLNLIFNKILILLPLTILLMILLKMLI